MRKKTHILLLSDSAANSSLARALSRPDYILKTRALSKIKLIARRPVYHDVAIFHAGASSQKTLDALCALHVAGQLRPLIVISKTQRIDAQMRSFIGAAERHLVHPLAEDVLVQTISRLVQSRAAGAVSFANDRTFRLERHGERFALDGRVLRLSKNQSLILGALLRKVGQFVPPHEVQSAIYGVNPELKSNITNVLILKLKMKLSAYGINDCIESKRGLGISLRGSPAHDADGAAIEGSWTVVGSAFGASAPPARSTQMQVGLAAPHSDGSDQVENGGSPGERLETRPAAGEFEPAAALNAQGRTPSHGFAPGSGLSPLERRLMALLLAREGCAISSQTIRRELYGETYSRGHKALIFHVMNLRRKLAQLDLGFAVETARGVGFRMVRRSNSPLAGQDLTSNGR